MTEKDHMLDAASLPRRKKFAEVAAKYPNMLVQVCHGARLYDGVHDSEGRELVRELETEEQAKFATLTAAGFFCAMLKLRAQIENDNSMMFDFWNHARNVRLDNRTKEFFPTETVSVLKRDKAMLVAMETQTLNIVLTALSMEARTPAFNELEFWTGVFRGMSDTDPSGVVPAAARLVLLDHIPEFGLALTADAIRPAPMEH